MIKRNTVLVLGAGASKPYGLPTGLELRDFVRTMAHISKDDGRLPLFDQCGVSRRDLLTLGNAFLGSGVRSIDAFLERHPSLVDTGKLVIARHICENEAPAEVIGQRNDNWYEYLWHYMHTGLAEADQVGGNHTAFTTSLG